MVGIARLIAGIGLGLTLWACAATAPTESSLTESGPTVSTEIGWTVEACSNDDVEAILGESDGAGGQIVGFVVFAARTDRPCSLSGAPELRLIDATGRVIAAAQERPPVVGEHPVVLAPGSGPPDPDGARAGQGSFTFLVGNVCVRLPDDQARVIVRLLGESEALELPTPISLPSCGTRGRPPFLGVQPFASPIPE